MGLVAKQRLPSSAHALLQSISPDPVRITEAKPALFTFVESIGRG